MSNLVVSPPVSQRRPLRICTDVPLLVGYPSNSSSPSNRSATPSAITPGEKCFFHVLCMHDFESSDPGHLPFEKDEVLTIIQQELSGWWAAMRPYGDHIGWIPSSFVLPLGRRKITEYPEETPWPCGSFNYGSPSAVHEAWVPVSDDYKHPSFKIVTPTDLYEGMFDDRLQNHNHELFFHLSCGDRRVDIGDICVLPIPESPSFHTTHRLPTPSTLSSALQLYRHPASPSPIRTELHHHGHFYAVDEETSSLCSTTSVGSGPGVPLYFSVDAAESLAVFKPVTSSRGDTCTKMPYTNPSGCQQTPAWARFDHGVSDTSGPCPPSPQFSCFDF